MSRLILRGGRIIDPANRRDEIGDLYLADQQVVEAFPDREADRIIDLDSSQWVCPGWIDSMAHLCEPGMSTRETIETGTEAAAAGGFTSLINMPGNNPPTDEVHRLIWVIQRIAERARVNVFPTATISRNMQGELLTPIGSLHRAGAVALTDHRRCLQNNEIMRRALEYASMFDIPILDHCRDETLSPGGVMHEGFWSARLGLRGWPAIAEEMMVSRNALLAEMIGARVHCLQVTTAGSLRIIEEAKSRGVAVTAGATPHHLCFTDAALADYDSVFKVSPPLRSGADLKALRDSVRRGVVDFLCSDHSPHCGYEKEVEFDDAPFGLSSLETALAASLTAMVHESGMAPLDFVALWTSRPAAFFKLDRGTLSPGRPADVTVINPDLEWTVNPSTFRSKAKSSPFAGTVLRGQAIFTIVRGRIVWEHSTQ